MRLLSKIQYKKDENGEFHDAKVRDCDETIALVLSYPWATERTHAAIELTCPSVTIEHPIGSYLKIGPYFSGKYSVYYLENNVVYLKTCETIEDACSWVKAYFKQDGKLNDFKKYGFTINAVRHFRSRKFEYTVNVSSVLKICWFQLIMLSFFIILWLFIIIYRPHRVDMLMTAVTVFCLLTTVGPTAYLFYNYLKLDKHSYLRISRGHDNFRFGTINNAKIYKKQDIESIERHKTEYYKRPWYDCEVFVMTLKNGDTIKFTSLLILGDTLRSKFPDHQITEVRIFFPTIESV